ncbi:propanediol utilization microcompartment protein PduB [Clostridium botulinum]|uniref:propanediol utilization microcompartment protein PduB n=1 Tax=Clostridium botulinum TaxID=1491 RepID=UPI0007733E95|nr:propanediol utilization microcompartment protein PduB [Clostridium botulinum]MBN1064944.1 propanediol utilization microcompartment protein PduB [Clostridium botulinum]MBN1071264.1 propanediol utilization microcompartment protein PduB [Clostridium botulinum]NFG36688.1 propanediol utilization microcompartment protein PduB [Clostridium botulinum]NFH80472.1 propanediol utilization microcompartment protein PduB [Clostridium botulinum]NFH83441.1 propanediol utilization microcompartment protein Pd
MQEQLIRNIISEVLKNVENTIDANPNENKEELKNIQNFQNNKISLENDIPEFVGSAIGDTVGLVIANVNELLLNKMNVSKKYRSIGIIGARTGASAQIISADEAVKGTNSEIIKVELARDTKGNAGHGVLIVFGAMDVSDVRQAVEITLNDLNRTFGNLYINECGHLEIQYTPRSSYACNKAFNAPIGTAFGVIVGAPAAIGLLMADSALKASNVDIIDHWSPAYKTSYSNECVTTIYGDSEAVKQALITAREVGINVLSKIGSTPTSQSTPYI